jgi:outer membrane receptor protein involved in Fe transport
MGVHTQYFSTNNEVVLEPRLGVRYAFSDKNSMNVGYGMHHQTLPIYNLFAQDAAGNAPNKSLEFTRANHIVLGYDQMITRSMKLRIETYYQWLDKVPVHTYASSYSVLNLGASFNPSDEVNLTNTGKGTNYGVELTLEQYFTKGFYFLITGSLFESKYKGSDGIERNTAFNSNYACNVLAGKEFKVSKKGSIVYLNLKFTTLGGRYFTPVDLAASGVARRAIYDNALAFTEKQSAYIRGDMKVGYRKDFVHSSLEFAVDFQNITNHQNIFAIGYNARTNSIGKQYQQGFFPVPMFRFTF